AARSDRRRPAGGGVGTRLRRDHRSQWPAARAPGGAGSAAARRHGREAARRGRDSLRQERLQRDWRRGPSVKLSNFFIDRPIFAGVISAFITIAGLLALSKLPISEYPEVVPPQVIVHASYPGANPKVIADTVAAPLEQAIVGVEDMLYMSSTSTMDGSLTLTVTFKIGADIDRAQVQVQNRVSQALPRLPEEVRSLGVNTVKASSNLTLVVNLTSPNGRYDSLYLRNYAVLNIRDVLARLPGMGDVQVFGGGDYSMRVWLDPQKLAARNLTAGDVVAAIREQNVQVAAGQLGAPPSPGTQFQIALNAAGRLTDEQQFRDIIVKTGDDGQVVRLGDIARVELGAQAYGVRSLLDNRPSLAIPVFQSPGANALELSGRVRKTMEELKKNFPEGMDYGILYDPTQFVQQSIDAVLHTLLEAIALVVLVVILFLQTWRASLIPLIAVPVSVVGTFAVLLAFGFSINTLSLFGLVLAIGIVVDDAIVVVENVERHIAEGLSPLEATKVAMSEVSRPIIAITLVLVAVFGPVAFVSGRAAAAGRIARSHRGGYTPHRGDRAQAAGSCARGRVRGYVGERVHPELERFAHLLPTR